MRIALEDAGIEPGDVDVIFADASGVPESDAIEARAIKEVFGDRERRCAGDRAEDDGRAPLRGRRALDVAAALLAMRTA